MRVRVLEGAFIHSMTGIRIPRGSTIGIIYIGPTVPKLFVKTLFPIEISNLKIPEQTRVHQHYPSKTID